MDTITQGNCIDLANTFAENSINLIVTSPPYAEQRNKQYGGIPVKEYPQWTVKWCDAYRQALKPNASIAIVIRANIHNGEISDYVLRTRLAMREAGFIEAEELIWIKPDSPPLGHTGRPRRAWENILWFSKSRHPFCDPKANGQPSDRVGFESIKGVGDYKCGVSPAKIGIARCRDYVEVGTGSVDKSPENIHPAQFPEKLAMWAVRLLCPIDGTVLDPFVGGGTTLVACERLNKEENYALKYYGIDLKDEYCKIATNRLNKLK
jgi:site-specific DNA-methyltransferase (adenine-specific)